MDSSNHTHIYIYIFIDIYIYTYIYIYIYIYISPTATECFASQVLGAAFLNHHSPQVKVDGPKKLPCIWFIITPCHYTFWDAIFVDPLVYHKEYSLPDMMANSEEDGIGMARKPLNPSIIYVFLSWHAWCDMNHSTYYFMMKFKSDRLLFSVSKFMIKPYPSWVVRISPHSDLFKKLGVFPLVGRMRNRWQCRA